MAKDLISEFVGAISTDTPDPNTTYNAIVSRVDADGTVWVSVEGSSHETPTASVSSEVKRGDAVKVEWRNNKLYIAGNYTDPAVGAEKVESVNTTAREALELADSAKADIQSVNQYFWHVKSGAERGAHITEIPQAAFAADPSNGGGNLLARSDGIVVRNGTTELATFGANGSQIGKDDEGHVVTASDGVALYVGNEDIVHLHHYRGQIAYLSNNNGKSVVIDSWESPTSTGDRSSVSVKGGGSYGSAIELTANSTGTNNQPLMAGILVQADNALDEEKIYLYGKVEATGYVRDTIISATPTITRTSGGTVSSIVYKRTGNVAMLSFAVAYNTSVAAGANVFEGTIPDGYRPVTHARGCGYYGAHSIIGQISSTGEITIRNASSTAVTLASGGVGLTFTYIIE